jgi:putative transposase
MSLTTKPKRYRFPVEIISYTVWSYQRFNDSYRDVSERLQMRGLLVSHETIRKWCIKFGSHFSDVIKKRERKPTDKWHLDEMHLKINGEKFMLWRPVDSEGQELDIFLQKRRNKKAAIRFLSRLLKSYHTPRVIITDKVKSYNKPMKYMCKGTDHRSHKGLNDRVENAR